MKFNLKNRPLAYDGGSVGCKEYAKQMNEWFEGFEKELREMCQECPANSKIENQSPLSCSLDVCIKWHPKEILGE